jgi:hypothetical protein
VLDGIHVLRHLRLTDVQVMRDMFIVKDIIVLSIVIELEWG